MRHLQDIARLASHLQLSWAGHTLHQVDDLNGRLNRHLANVDAAEILPRLTGRRVHSVRRRGRHLLITLASGSNLYRWFVLQWTPGPTGNFIAGASGEFGLVIGDTRWGYVDRVGWGRLWLWTQAEVAAGGTGLSTLGPDWLDARREAEAALRNHGVDSSRAVKAILVDQTIAAGLDNVLATEALYAAGIHPHRIWRWLSPVQRSRLAQAAGDLVAAESFSAKVYGRENDWCLGSRCTASICAVRDLPPLPTRSFVCRSCQPEPEVGL